MIKFLLILLLIPCLAWPYGGMGPGPGFKTYSGGASVTFLIDEDFTGTGTPTDWIVGAGCSFNDEMIIAATHGGTFTCTSPDFSGATEMWGVFDITFPASLPGEALIYELHDTSSSQLLEISLLTSGFLTVAQGGLGNIGDVDFRGTTKRLWWHYEMSSGSSDGVAEVWMGETASSDRPGTIHLSRIDGDALTAGEYAVFYSQGASVTFVYDNVKIANEEFTSIP